MQFPLISLDNRKIMILILLLFFHFVLSLYYSFFVEKEEVNADECIYSELARSVVDNGSLSDSKPLFFCPLNKPTAFRMPVYPLFVSCVMRLTGKDHFILPIRVIQCIMGILFLIILSITCSLIFDSRCAIVLLILSCFFQPFIYFYAKILSEFFACFFCLLVLYCLSLLQYHKRSLLIACLIGIFYSLASLTRPNMFLLGLPILAGILLVPAEIRTNKVKQLGIIFLIFTLSLGVWMLRNYAVFDKMGILTTSSGLNLYSAAFGERDYYKDIEPVIKTMRNAPHNEVQWDACLYQLAREKFLNDPFPFIKKIPAKIKTFLFADFKQAEMSLTPLFIVCLLIFLFFFSFKKNYYLLLFSLLFWIIPFYHSYQESHSLFYFFFRKVNFCISNLYPFFLIGLIPLYKKPVNRRMIVPILLTILVFFIQNALIVPRIRYRFIIEPYLLMIASYGIVFIFEKIEVLKKKFK
jgi:hypothetical protein